jgi:2-polyprenyl-6-methoxyphenol hydroxylase-like FAD-dependent oxidoreductase
MSPPRPAYDVAVVGAGPIGLATALLLVREAGFAAARVAVIDRRPPESLETVSASPMDLRVFALSRASERMRRLGGHPRHAYRIL